MASFFRRRRGLLFKAIIAVPLIWILAVLLFSSSGKLTSNQNDWSVDIDKREKPLHPPPKSLHIENDFKNHDNQIDSEPLGHDRKIHEVDKNIESRKLDDNLDSREGKSRQREKEMRLRFEPREADNKDTVEKNHDPNGPGEQGKPININKDTLSSDERKKYDDGWQKNAYNQYVSDMMSLHRSLPDVRDVECKDEKYRGNLPDTSVVVCFHNEAWTVLLRTIHSILDRSPKHLIKEIILVDDFSDMDHLKKPLQEYTEKLGKVKIVRAKKREGLIRARLLGFAAATADTVTFLDSHCECTEGWLEPLLDRIAENKTTVVCPVIDVIEDDTFKYQYGSAKATSIGGFDWNMQFTWHAIPEYERRRRNNDIAPLRSPTMAGGLFTISREYFEHLGTYDPGMDIWGGENLELSFRVWMCGGTLEIIPCSHVGHIFRKRSPYKWRTGVNVVKKNSVRLAEVWMDEYRDYYYERFNHDLGDFGDVTARKELRKNLHCKSFDWFVKNVYPDLFVPGESIASGEIRSKAKPMCIDSPSDHHSYHKPVNMWPCHAQGGNQASSTTSTSQNKTLQRRNEFYRYHINSWRNIIKSRQYWMLSKNSEIRRDDGCLDYSGGEDVIIYPCHGQKGNQEWQYRADNTLFHVNTQKCAEVSVDGKKLLMKHCTGVDRQLWKWKKKTPKS